MGRVEQQDSGHGRLQLKGEEWRVPADHAAPQREPRDAVDSVNAVCGEGHHHTTHRHFIAARAGMKQECQRGRWRGVLHECKGRQLLSLAAHELPLHLERLLQLLLQLAITGKFVISIDQFPSSDDGCQRLLLAKCRVDL